MEREEGGAEVSAGRLFGGVVEGQEVVFAGPIDLIRFQAVQSPMEIVPLRVGQHSVFLPNCGAQVISDESRQLSLLTKVPKGTHDTAQKCTILKGTLEFLRK